MDQERRNDFFFKMMDESPRGFYIVRIEMDEKGEPKDWTYIYCNDVVAELGNLQKEQLIGHTFSEVYPNGSDKWLKVYYDAACRNVASDVEEFSEEIGCYLHIQAFPSGQKDYCCCYVMDARKNPCRYEGDPAAISDTETPLKQNLLNALIEVRESNDHLQETLETERVKNEIISAISTLYLEIARVDLETMTYELVAGPDYGHVRAGMGGSVEHLRDVLLNKNIFQANREQVERFIDFTTLNERLHDRRFIQQDLKAASGKWYDCKFIVKRRDEDGKVTHVLMAVRDIDEQKKHELEYQEQLKEAKEEAEAARERAERAQKEAEAAKERAEEAQKEAEAARERAEEARLDADRANEAKTGFLRRMSHDIRTPINGIRGMVQIAKYYEDDPAKVQECREKIWTATEHLLSLVNDVLDMNKLESGKLTLRHEPFSLQKVLDEVHVVTQAQAEELHVRFIHQDTQKLEHDHMIGSPVYLKRIFMNFTSNAVKYNREGGTVSVYGRELSFDGKTAWYEFVCEDTGLGMSEEFQRHAFEPFTQEEQAAGRTHYTGTGLGLAISKQLIDLLGGTLELQSVLGKGTKVTFRIPIEVDLEEHAKETVSDCTAARFEGVRALLVEDNELNAEIAAFLLEQHGLQVMRVSNGQMAVEELEEYPGGYDVVFMDVMMPVMDGLEATKVIRTKLRSAIPVFAMTANAFVDDIQRSMDAGMDEYLTKPLQEKAIVKALRRHVTESVT